MVAYADSFRQVKRPRVPNCSIGMSFLHTPAPVLRGDRRLDIYIIVALSLATIATRLPLMPPLIANADGAGYAFGMDHFDPVLQHTICKKRMRLA